MKLISSLIPTRKPKLPISGRKLGFLGAQIELPSEEWKDEQCDELYKFIGHYVVIFQHIESMLDQMLMLAIGLDSYHVGQSVVAKLSNRDRIEVLRSIVSTSSIADGDEYKQEWMGRFNKTLQELEKEAARRNKIVHSVYLFEFLEIGLPPMQSKRRIKKGEVDFDREDLDGKTRDETLRELAKLAWDVGFLHKQLIHWSDHLTRSGGQKQEKVDETGVPVTPAEADVAPADVKGRSADRSSAEES